MKKIMGKKELTDRARRRKKQDIIHSLRAAWWEKEDPQLLASTVFSAAHGINNMQAIRTGDFSYYGQLYGATFYGLRGSVIARRKRLISEIDGGSVRYSLVREVVDTLHSSVTSTEPKSMALTQGGGASAQIKAKKINDYTQGVRLHTNGNYVAALAARDAMVFGTGFAKVSCVDGQFQWERLYPWEVRVDDADGIYGNPRNMYHVINADKQTLIDVWGDTEERRRAILDGGLEQDGPSTVYNYTVDQVTLCEAWRLPSRRGAGDGRHVICTTAGKILDEPWDDLHFPIRWMHAIPPISGFWGTGVAEECGGLQLEVNRLANKNYESMRRLGVPMVFADTELGPAQGQISNKVAAIYNTKGGQPPTVFIPPSMLKEYLVMIDGYYKRAFEMFGVSQMLNQGEKPSGIDSGKAYQTWLDQGNGRLSTMIKAYARFNVELDLASIECARREFASGNDISVDVPGKKFLRTIKWSDIDMDDDQFVLQMFPVNLFSQQPGAKMKQVQDMVAGGLLGPERAMGLLDFPDTEALVQQENAPYELYNYLIEKMGDKKYTPPDPLLPLLKEYGLPAVQNALMRGMIDGEDPEVLELYRTFINEGIQLLSPLQAEPPPPQPDMGAAMAPGAPAPQMPPEGMPV